MLRTLLIILCFAPLVLQGKTVKADKKKLGQVEAVQFDYVQSPYVVKEEWDQVCPHFLPFNHPLKAKLDKIFGSSRVIANSQTLAAAGFTDPYPRQWSKTIVTTHPLLKGYYFKMYTDDQTDKCDYIQWQKRIAGANAIQELINTYGSQRYFKVPKKWIYPLPAEPSPPIGSPRKNFILIAEDMGCNHGDKNRACWRKISKERLNALYWVVQTLGLRDSQPFNIPFCEDGKQAFVDTEHHHSWPVPYQKMLRHIPSKMQSHFWNAINVETRGKI